ncbi:L-ribulose-5-phosphate 4-epimerase [Arthrobacter crystallopoietes BAB-32]|uniref:L-ribulose-5-phosphate 4-epimerase n=2 Tax=Crystallibacter crystallopoietes TaxID=37928 RepID=N1UYS5_9MICC|nr:L-ribulose-5-phosphate 4-epimerase [Arthrobacter crystallopoietes BAB-32]
MTEQNMIKETDSPQDLAATVAQVRTEVSALHAYLVTYKLVVWTAGNVSARVPGQELMVIKPSGIEYDQLAPELMIVTDLHGVPVDGVDSAHWGNPDLAPSSDTDAHAYVYRHMPDVHGVVHTHSPYATAWAALDEPVPCVLTMMADEFGGDIPIGPFALIGDDSIGRGIVETLRESKSPAVLMKNHGPFTIGPSAKAAVKAAVMVEEVAKTVHIARQIGTPIPIDAEHVARLNDRYMNVYGQ